MRILFVASEVVPFSKTGGLGDVSGALPGALAALGHEVKVVTPLYGSIKDGRLEDTGVRVQLRFPFGEQSGPVKSVFMSELHEVLFLENQHYFGSRTGLYGDRHGDYGDNHRRFAYLALGALQLCELLDFVPDIVHLNDWQTGLAPVALQRGYAGSALESARSVYTVHNLAYQGHFSKDIMGDLGLPWELFNAGGGLEFHDGVNFMKAGLTFADALTTVSPRYAEEIQGPELGCQLDGLLRRRRDVLSGIVNGIDTEDWDPEKDPHLPARFSVEDLGGKAVCKREMQRMFNLPQDPGVPVFGLVSRLADQKGIDLLLSALPHALGHKLQLVFLGSGEPRFEWGLKQLAARAPWQVGVRIGFDNALSHVVEAGCDFFMMPSRYEPCGLNQMYSLRYGTVPLVRATGGLDDTVEDYGQEGTGLKFGPFEPGEFLTAMARALALYADPERLADYRRRGMEQDFSWAASARRYESLYRAVLAGT